jgi:hypothetical protein
MIEEIKLETGKKYPIITTLDVEEYGILNNYECEAFYIGKKPVETPWYLEPKKAEGNIFISIIDNNLKIFCTGSTREKGIWYCDGDDDPCYFAGIKADNRTKSIKLSKLEQEYLINKINEWGTKNAT